MSWVKSFIGNSFIHPDRTILLYVSEKVMIERIIKRGGPVPNKQDKLFLRCVSKIMEELPEDLVGKFIKIENSSSIEEVTQKIIRIINLH